MRRSLFPQARRDLAHCALALLFLTAPPAAADWLVQNDGKRIETRGPWRRQGDWYFYTDPSGAFRAVLAKEIDLEASQIETRKPTASPRASESPAARAAPANPRAEPAASAAPPPRTVTPEPPLAAPPVEAAAPAARAVTLYSTSWCPYCRQARALLDRLGVPYLEKDIEKDEQARRELAAKAGARSGVPVLEIAGTLVRGYNEARIRELTAGAGTSGKKGKKNPGR